MPLRFAPKSLNRILASIHKDFEFSTVEAASPQNPMRKGRLDNFHALHTNPPRWPPQRHELLPVCVPGATFRHISGPRKGTALTHEKCTRFRGPSRYIKLLVRVTFVKSPGSTQKGLLTGGKDGDHRIRCARKQWLVVQPSESSRILDHHPTHASFKHRGVVRFFTKFTGKALFGICLLCRQFSRGDDFV